MCPDQEWNPNGTQTNPATWPGLGILSFKNIIHIVKSISSYSTCSPSTHPMWVLPTKIYQSWLHNPVCHHHYHPNPCHLPLLPGHHGSLLAGNPASTTLLSLLHWTARVFLLNYKSNHTPSCSKLPMPSHHFQNKIRSPSPGHSGLPRSIGSLVTSPISCLHTLPSPLPDPGTLASLFSGPARHIPVAGLCAALSSDRGFSHGCSWFSLSFSCVFKRHLLSEASASIPSSLSHSYYPLFIHSACHNISF